MSPNELPADKLPELPSIDFESAAPVAAKGTSCTACKQEIRAIYYEATGQVICPSCRNQLQSQLSPDGGRIGRFGKALVFGFLAAIAGTVLYLAIAMATGMVFGLVAILIGWMVGKAVFVGSGRRGGRRYQILAALLIVLSSIPILLDASVISFVICGFAIWRAWQTNNAVDVTITGPYRIAAPPAASASAA